ncbi:hypothetical protein, partial [Enterobacter sichuanensis]|uniref:hypothetical protein n=1 Tax=Enterobacter sichuanensis TaxID=2071710 RepID=UPI0012FED9DD
GNGSHASTLKSPSYTKSVSWQHYHKYKRVNLAQMKRFLLYIGLENVSFIKHDGVSEPKNNGIFHGRWDNVTSGARHWIACYEGLYFDPLLPHPVPHLPEGFHVTQIFNHP